MNLKELLGEDLFKQVDGKIQAHNNAIDDKSKHIKYVDLSEGGYVSQEKYGNLKTEVDGYKTQLDEAKATIGSYKDMDVEGIKKSVGEWEEKYNTDTQALKDKLEEQKVCFAAEKYIDGQGIKSGLAKKAILNEFLDQKLEYKDNRFLGADEYMKKVREQYPEDFNSEEESKKTFVRGTTGTHKPSTTSEEEAYRENKYGKNKYYKK